MTDKMLVAAMVAFMVMQFCVPSYAVFSFWFYLAIAAPAIYASKNCLRELWQNWGGKTLLLLFAYVAVHAIFFYEPLQTLRHAAINAIFILAMMLFHRNLTDAHLKQFIRLMLCVVVLCGIISIVKYFAVPQENERLIPIGQNNHEILGANIYALFTLAGLCLWGRLRDNLLIIAAILVTLELILLTQSRGPLIAFCCTGAVGLLMLRYYKTLALGVVIAAIIIADMWFFYHSKQSILPLAPYYEQLLDALNRKSHRLEIWQLAWQLIQQRPLAGYGLQANFPYGYAGVNPHNLFISTWYYTGVVGFILLLATTIFALINLYKNRHQTLGFIGLLILTNGVIACCTDQGQLFKTPSALWFIFWWGITISCAISSANSAKSTTSPQT